MITVEYCNYKGCTRDCADMNIPCPREGYYIYDTASELWFTGSVWSSDWEDAKKYRTERKAMQATVDQEHKQKSVVAELSVKFGG